MAQGFNTCFRNLPPLSSDSRTLNVPLDSEDSLAHHLESLIEHNDLSNTVVSPENISSDLNLSSNFFSNSNTSSDFVQQKYYDDVVWQDEGQPVHHEDDEKENECAWKSPKTNTGSPESMSTTESEVEEDQDEPPEKEKETFMMQENKYSETSGAPESLSVSEDEGEKDHLDGEAHEKDETCMEQDDQHTDTPSGGEKSLTASVNERKEELDDEAQNAEEGCMEEEDRYSNVSNLEGQNEGTIISESFKEEEHSLSQGTVDSQGIDASNAQDSAHKLNDNTCAFEYQDSVKDNDSLNVAGQENGKSSSVICGLGLGVAIKRLSLVWNSLKINR
ncbi:serine/threonine-protein phosphatase 4 regulatory subunit 2-like [Oncorhynchus masou masou]|uniref:serine/threonine-protein phosphatase 4 regulatory subunit 2-like n=1 Tax=Oncorhynchus masou masou TaxID=90313 RepID=UPI0031835A5B